MMLYLFSHVQFLRKTQHKKIWVPHDATNPIYTLNDYFPKIIVINRPLEKFLDSNGFVIIGVADFLLRFIK